MRVVYVSMADLARAKLDSAGDLRLDGEAISVIYSRYDFSHPWGRCVDDVPAGDHRQDPSHLLNAAAELAGALPMSKATRALVSKMNEPAKTQTKMERQPVPHGVSLRSTYLSTLAQTLA